MAGRLDTGRMRLKSSRRIILYSINCALADCLFPSRLVGVCSANNARQANTVYTCTLFGLLWTTEYRISWSRRSAFIRWQHRSCTSFQDTVVQLSTPQTLSRQRGRSPTRASVFTCVIVPDQTTPCAVVPAGIGSATAPANCRVQFPTQCVSQERW